VGEMHRSIGEVLGLLRDEFPDVTISKIRFLESQGLVDPERTPSGYRRFYDKDIERLRWILRQQRENYLPLKVIKDRLEGVETPEADEADLAPAEAPVPAPRKARADLTVEPVPRRVLPEPTLFAGRAVPTGRDAAEPPPAPSVDALAVVSPAPAELPCLAVVSLETGDLRATAACLASRGVKHEATDRVLVPPEEACGVALEFVSR